MVFSGAAEAGFCCAQSGPPIVQADETTNVSVVEGLVQAPSRQALLEQLRHQHLYPVTVDEATMRLFVMYSSHPPRTVIASPST